MIDYRRGISSETECCVNCRHFFQHYVRSEIGTTLYWPLYEGHCGYPRKKLRYLTDVCDRFERQGTAEKTREQSRQAVQG